MKLELEGEAPKLNPTDEDIRHGIQRLDGKKIGFAILDLDDLFIQVAIDAPDEFTMEYQNGTSDEHYTTSGPVTESEVIDTFQACARGETSWFDRFQWDKMNLNKGIGCLPCLILTVLTTSSLGLAAIIKQ